MSHTFKIGSRVQTGAEGTEEHDTGTVNALGEFNVEVQWDKAECSFWETAEDLRALPPEKDPKLVVYRAGDYVVVDYGENILTRYSVIGPNRGGGSYGRLETAQEIANDLERSSRGTSEE